MPRQHREARLPCGCPKRTLTHRYRGILHTRRQDLPKPDHRLPRWHVRRLVAIDIAQRRAREHDARCGRDEAIRGRNPHRP